MTERDDFFLSADVGSDEDKSAPKSSMNISPKTDSVLVKQNVVWSKKRKHVSVSAVDETSVPLMSKTKYSKDDGVMMAASHWQLAGSNADSGAYTHSQQYNSHAQAKGRGAASRFHRQEASASH